MAGLDPPLFTYTHHKKTHSRRSAGHLKTYDKKMESIYDA